MSLVFLLAILMAFTDQVPSLNGIVVDPSDAPIAGAVIAVLNAQGANLQETLSGADGHFSIVGLTTGSYALKVKARNFSVRQIKVDFEVRELPPVKIKLEVAATSSEVTVTATRGNVESALTVGQMVTVRERVSLLERPLATIGHALEGSPGIMIQETTYGNSSPHLRGLTGYQTLLLVDGVRFNTTLFRSGPNQYLAYLNPGQVERIEAVLGPASATFGSDSLGGTINLLTPEPDFNSARGGSRVHGEFSAMGASADTSGTSDARLTFGGRRISWIIGATARRLGNLRPGAGEDSHNVYFRYFGMPLGVVRNLLGPRLIDTAFGQYGADTKLALQPTPDQSLTFQYMYSGMNGVRSYRDQLGGQFRMQSLFSPQSLNFGYARYEKRRLGFLDSLTGTFSVNSQSDGSVRQNPRLSDPVTTDLSRVESYGYSLQGGSHLGSRNVLVFGGEVYDEKVTSSRFTADAAKGTTVKERASFPNGSRYLTTGLFAQSAHEIVRGQLRAVLGTRFTDVRLRTYAERNRDAAGALLGVADSSSSFRDVTFNAGLSWQASRLVGVNLLVGRGFRAPNLYDLSSIGLVTLAYEVPSYEAIAVGALMGADGGDGALSTGKPVEKLVPESLLNYELGLNFRTSRFHSRIQAFDAELLNPISGRTLLFPADRVPATIADIPVTPIPPSAKQKAQGIVAVATPLGPRAMKCSVNDGRSKYYGVDSLVSFAIHSEWRVEGNYTFLAGRDLNPNRAARRLPPQQGVVAVRHTSFGRSLWLELRNRFAGPQNRLNGADIDDDRIGASRRRSDIAGFFRSGDVSPHLLAGSDGKLETADDVFSPTGETLRQIQDRVLPIGATINGVRVVDDSTRVPLYLGSSGWLSVEVRGGWSMGERTTLHFGVTNLLDRNYRIHGSGVDVAGINFFLGLRYIF